MDAMGRVAEWFECDGDGYPTDESLERLRAFKFDMETAAAFMLNDLEPICEGIAIMSLVRSEGKTDYGDNATFFEYHTGGWSGSEDLIGAMLSHFWIGHYHTKWERGGHFYFEVVPHPLSAPTQAQPRR